MSDTSNPVSRQSNVSGRDWLGMHLASDADVQSSRSMRDDYAWAIADIDRLRDTITDIDRLRDTITDDHARAEFVALFAADRAEYVDRIALLDARIVRLLAAANTRA
jgi:hypothetical protein